MSPAPVQRRVTSGEVSLALREHGPAGPGRPTVVLVHGYPDQQEVWDRLVARLPVEEWHVVTYDVRGAGASDAPHGRRGYRADRLVTDLVTVLDEVLADGEAAHLVGHDWGSVQLWDAVAAERSDSRLRGRLASFTSISGPSLDHAGWLARHTRGRKRALVRQLLRSWYVGLFCLPLLPTVMWRIGHPWLGRAGAAREGLPPGHWGPSLGRNAVNGLGLYRANVFQRVRRPRVLATDVPVLVLHPTGDSFLTDLFQADLDVVCTDLRMVRIDAGHWAAVTHPDVVADAVVGHVRSH